MVDSTQIKEHMEVVDGQGQHLGTVDHIDGGRIKLTKSDPAAGGEHHYIDVSSVKSIDDRIHLGDGVEPTAAADPTE